LVSNLFGTCRNDTGAGLAQAQLKGDAVMKARFSRIWTQASRANPAVALGLILTLFAIGSASAELATPEQKRACTPDVYRLCAGEIPNVRAITACLRRQRASLSEACRAVFEHDGVSAHANTAR
jgi:hypothetical protein